MKFILSTVALAVTCHAAAITTIATGLTGPGAVSVAGNTVYFSAAGVISSVGTNGGPVTQLYPGYPSPNDTTVIGSTLFWIDANSGPITDTQILSAPAAGGGPVTPIYTGSLVGQPIVDGMGITNDGTQLYTSDEFNGRVHTLNPNGSGLTQLGPDRYSGGFGSEHGNWIVAFGGTLYILDGGRSGVDLPQVVTIPVGGGSFSAPLWIGAPFNAPSGITEGNGQLYIADGATIWTMPILGGAPTVFYSGGPLVNIGVSGIFFDNQSLYVADSGSGSILRFDLVPEPSTLVLFATGMLLLVCASKFRGFSWIRRRLPGGHRHP